GASITDRPPYRRNIGVVFQQYALFPHLTVFQNVAYPLQMRRASKADIVERVRRALGMVRLDGFADRYPRQLSGGQQQRVALARAIVFEPPVLLMDEPLGALDKRLREDMQVELRHLQRELGITTVSVTHDQVEALVMSDVIAVRGTRYRGEVLERLYVGGLVKYRLLLDQRDALIAETLGPSVDQPWKTGQQLTVGWDPADCLTVNS